MPAFVPASTRTSCDTESVYSWHVRNVTVTLDEETARWARIEAARREMSVSRLIRNLLEESMRRNQAYEVAMREYLSRPARPISANASYPKRDEIHDRASLR